MSMRLNCWEFRNCGMEPGGIFAKIHGKACPTTRMMKLDGVNGGQGAGRACWMIMNNSSEHGSLICRNNRQSCFHCEFYRRVHSEEEILIASETTQDTTYENNKFILL